ncbi:MAG: response regulator [Thermodesulfobacteriota bacterium]
MEIIPPPSETFSLAPDKLMGPDEVVVLVDDDAAIREPLALYLGNQGFPVLSAASAAGLLEILDQRRAALVILDIGLPDTDGLSLLPRIVGRYQDLAIIMLTGVVDLHVALECIRKGADDYLSKPVQFHEILLVVKRALEKRRLVIDNRRYQEQLERTSFRTGLLHQLSNRMNTVYLSTVELDEILRAVLVGITAEEGLGFNRAFLALFDQDDTVLRGRMAIGPSCREEAGRIWDDIKQQRLGLMDIIRDLAACRQDDSAVNRVIRQLAVPVASSDHILIRAARERRSFNIVQGQGNGPVPADLIGLLGHDSFVVVPLFSPSRAHGVIIADNFVTRRPVSDENVADLAIIASQASLAIDQAQLYAEQGRRIQELQDLTQELEKNKDLLVKAERHAALGQVAAQLVHAIRNPIASLGGMARRMLKTTGDNEVWGRYARVIVKESERLETTLEEIFDFVELPEINPEPTPLNTLIRKTILLLQPTLTRQEITVALELVEPDPVLLVDPVYMKQAVLQIARNAAEAMPEGGTLTARSRIGDDGWIHIEIEDTGLGIADAHLARVKEPFFTTKMYGTGMGLAVVERIVSNHRGSFTIGPMAPRGTRVRINLPPA